MALRLGDTAPNFVQKSTFGEHYFHAWLSTPWGLLCSHPKDFTPACTTVLGATAKRKDGFARRDVNVLDVSVDALDSHALWCKDINETQNTNADFPVLADFGHTTAELYDMTHRNANDTLTVRSVFFIAQHKKIRASITYLASTGRNSNEILPVIDSLQLTDGYNVATPANWNLGDDVVIAPLLPDPGVLQQNLRRTSPLSSPTCASRRSLI
jgi:alkyl hydroperoxide reductase subunit AhpC